MWAGGGLPQSPTRGTVAATRGQGNAVRGERDAQAHLEATLNIVRRILQAGHVALATP